MLKTTSNAYEWHITEQLFGCILKLKKLKSFPSPKPDTSPSCKSSKTGLVCRVEWLFSSQLVPVYQCQFILLGEERHMCVNNLSRVASRLQVRRANH